MQRRGAPHTSSGRPVSGLLVPVVARLGLLVGLMGALAVVGVLLSTQAVNRLTDEVDPASRANQDVLQALTAMDAAVGAYARSGQAAALDDYRQAETALAGHRRRVREYAAGDPRLEPLVGRQEDAVEAWLRDYAEPRAAAPGGPGTFERQRYQRGQRRIDAVDRAHQATHEEFGRRVREAGSDARLVFRGTIIGLVLLALAAWLVLNRARARLQRELADPLVALESVVQRMARHDPDARADTGRGPREARAVALALNDFAEQQVRARAVEHRIQQELRALDTAKDDFVSNISHELRTPLTTISGYLELVAEEFEEGMGPRHERMLVATRRNVTRLKTLIDDLLTLSRAESRATDLEQTDLVQVVRDAATDVRITAARRGIRVEVSAPEGTVPVLADRAMLNRAFLNIVSNAVKFSREDGLVQVRVRLADGRVRVEVADRGIGIPSAELDRLGTRFFRATNAVRNEIAGTGLGVRIVQTIIDKHGGDVVIESEEGQGTTVTVVLDVHGDPVKVGDAA